MSSHDFETTETAWCPGCGNHAILKTLASTLTSMHLPAEQVVIVGGIGQAAKMPQYIRANGFCGLHGRALPAAVGIKIANKDLTVIVHTGDGDSYGEGGNHFLHNIRRNVDITHCVHNNQIYGLTKGQASPTTDEGHKTTFQPDGNKTEPMHPLAIAIASGCGFVARAFTGDSKQLQSIMTQAIRHKGYALVDILQPCVSFNKVNTFAWYKKRVYALDDTYDPTNVSQALQKAMEWGEKIPTGILYQHEKDDYHALNETLRKKDALIKQSSDPSKLETLFHMFQP